MTTSRFAPLALVAALIGTPILAEEPAKAPAKPASPPGPSPAAAASPAPPAPGPELLPRLNRVREVCGTLLGAVGESVVNKHYLKAKADLERGAGAEAIEEAINQIARAASILKGPATTEALIEQLKSIK